MNQVKNVNFTQTHALLPKDLLRGVISHPRYLLQLPTPQKRLCQKWERGHLKANKIQKVE